MKLLLTLTLLASAGLAALRGAFTAPPDKPYFESNGLQISEKSWDLILEFEVGGGQPYYEKYLIHPEWPKGASGVTIGVGYDLGYNSRQQILADWKDLPPEDLNLLAACAGIKGDAAKYALRTVSQVRVPWQLAMTVYKSRTVPRFAAATVKAYPGIDTLDAGAQGVMLSWVFNRGDGVSASDRDLEKRQIRAAVPGQPPRVPGYIRHSERLWLGTANGRGLVRRREAEADLWQSVYPAAP
jgi:hypothetical protein